MEAQAAPLQRQLRKGVSRAAKIAAVSGRKIIEMIPGAGAFFLLSIAKCFAIPSPYAICCLAALVAARVRPVGAIAGVALGMIFRIIWGIEWDVGQVLACLICLPAMKRRFKETWRLSAAAGGLLLLRSMPEIFRAQEMQSVILHLVSVSLGMVSMPALYRAARLLKGKCTEMEEDDLLCLLLPVLLMVAGASRLMVFGGNIGYFLSVLMVLFLAWAAGGALGICGGMGCGAALLLGGQSAVMLIVLSFGALIAGFFQKKNRLLPAGGFILASMAITYLTTFSFLPSILLTGFFAALFFVCVPRKQIQKAVLMLRKIRWAKPKDNAYTRLKMQRWVRAIEKIADELPYPHMDEIHPEEESEAISEKLCLECERLPICWHDQFDLTKAGMMALANRNEPDTYLALINRHFSFCQRIAKIPGILNEMDEVRQKARQRALCAEYERTMLQTHLTALSQAAQLISLEGSQQEGEEAYWLSQAEEAIHAMKFPGEAAFAKRVDGKMMVCLKCDPLALRVFPMDVLEKHMGVFLQRAMQVTEQKNGRIVLEEEPPLMLYTGTATACALAVEAEDGREKGANGDAVLVRQLSGGEAVLALSDGMGHGVGAQNESRKTLELLAHCMEAGYQRGQAMTAVNGMMLSATGGEKFATVDLCMIDLWTGEATLNKLGACASILAQGQRMHVIEGEALPLGIIEHVVPMEHRAMLGEGDVLLMMSDGITDAFNNQDEILEVVRRNRQDSPQHIADALLKAALDQRDGCPQDDMTVLCARICSRHPERKRRLEIA